MKNIIYNLIKFWIKTALRLYFGKIIVQGLDNVPISNPVLFLPNHQNALLDALLIAVDCNRKPYFLTRSDIFKSAILNKLFELVRMIPIYRIRDGRDSLKHNEPVFKKCADLLAKCESLLMFPEANHNLQRRVRPLSKGFTRILFKTLEQIPDLDIRLVPVGLNYLHGKDFPDKVAIYFGQDIGVQAFLHDGGQRAVTERIKYEVALALQKLTIHIPNEDYAETSKKLNEIAVDYLDPIATNAIIKNIESYDKKTIDSDKNLFGKIVRPFFITLNLPIVLLWKLWLKPKVWEPEFTATLRFVLALLAFPIYYTLIFIGFFFWLGSVVALVTCLVLFMFNWVYVKLG